MILSQRGKPGQKCVVINVCSTILISSLHGARQYWVQFFTTIAFVIEIAFTDNSHGSHRANEQPIQQNISQLVKQEKRRTSQIFNKAEVSQRVHKINISHFLSKKKSLTNCQEEVNNMFTENFTSCCKNVNILSSCLKVVNQLLKLPNCRRVTSCWLDTKLARSTTLK